MTPVLRMETAVHSGSKGEKENWRKRRLLLLVWAGWAVHGLDQESGRKEEGKEEEEEEEEAVSYTHLTLPTMAVV